MIGELCDLRQATHLKFILDFAKECKSPSTIDVEASFNQDSEWENAQITIDNEIMWNEKMYNCIRVFFPNRNKNRTYAINYGFIRQPKELE